ncbi:MAG: amidohydrolase, partial [Eubacteriales bacterium]|nr:amidohydrolase [Eubacteriales bacterium]
MQRLYFGGDIVTMEGEGDSVEAVLIENKRIKAAGLLAQLTPLCSSKAEKINLKGRTLMPSFIDPHGHISMAAQVSFMASLSKCTSFA